jgi:hypothetical protein
VLGHTLSFLTSSAALLAGGFVLTGKVKDADDMVRRCRLIL